MATLSTPRQTEIDARLAHIMDTPIAPGEPVAVGRNKQDLALLCVLCRLTVLESSALHARWSSPTLADPVAARFMRLGIERRMRMLNYLADAPRRAALEKK